MSSPRWWLWLVLGAGLMLGLVMAGWRWQPTAVAAIYGPITAADIQQDRLNSAPPIPNQTITVEQTFYPRWDGLREIELRFVRYSEVEEGENGRIHLQLFEDQNTPIYDETLLTSGIVHNQIHLIRFRPQPQSAGRQYTLRLSGSADNVVTVWGYDLDVYEAGEAQVLGGETAVKDLTFTTRYQLTMGDTLAALFTRLRQDDNLLLLALAFLPLPGCLLLLIGHKQVQRWDTAAWWGVALALGISIWPLLWYGVTLVNGRFYGWLLWLLFIIGWLVVIYLWVRRYSPSPQPSPLEGEGVDSLSLSGGEVGRGSISWQHFALLALLLLGLAVRLLAVRDLNIPPWVDASRHGLITAVMIENGRTISDYAPYLPIDRFPYHFGFHTLAASLSLMSKGSLPQLLLVLGQLLNGLLPLMVYTAVWLLTRQRNTGLLAAFLVGLPFFFPAYYATWGRFTQLTAMLIMPVLLAFTWLLLRGGRQWQQTWWLLALLIAGIFYIHFRVFLIYLPFVPIVWLMSRGRHTKWLAGTAVLALTLILPRLLQLLSITEPVAAITYQLSNYNAFPISYVRVGWETQFWWLAAIGLLMVLMAYLNRQRWTLLPMALTAWAAILAILLAGEKLGLPETSLLNLNSMYITLFVPLAIFLAILATHLWRTLKLITAYGISFRILITLYLLLGAGITAVTLFGIDQQITIINPQTVLARPQDLAGLQWADANLPDDAVVAVNSWSWLGGTWAGADGGAWLVPLTGLSSSTPPADYNYDADLFRQVDEFNQVATAVTDWSLPEQADWLRQQGITHIFIGAKGGFFDPAALAKNPEVQMIYGHNGVFIFELIIDN